MEVFRTQLGFKVSAGRAVHRHLRMWKGIEAQEGVGIRSGLARDGMTFGRHHGQLKMVNSQVIGFHFLIFFF